MRFGINDPSQGPRAEIGPEGVYVRYTLLHHPHLRPAPHAELPPPRSPDPCPTALEAYIHLISLDDGCHAIKAVDGGSENKGLQHPSQGHPSKVGNGCESLNKRWST